MPVASVSTAVRVKPGLRRNLRAARPTSLPALSSQVAIKLFTMSTADRDPVAGRPGGEERQRLRLRPGRRWRIGPG